MTTRTIKNAVVSAVGTTVLIAAATAHSAVGQATVTALAPVTQFNAINENLVNDGWHAKIKTKGVSDFHIVEVTIPPGGSLPWHIHLGPSFFIVKSGTATLYHGDDPTCTPAVLPAGSSLFEPGNDLHIVRNEGTVPLVNVVVQLIPAGAPRLIPQPAPGNCPF